MKRESRSGLRFHLCWGGMEGRFRLETSYALGVDFVCCAFAANDAGNVERRLCANALSAIARLFIRSMVFFSLEENCACGGGGCG